MFKVGLVREKWTVTVEKLFIIFFSTAVRVNEIEYL